MDDNRGPKCEVMLASKDVTGGKMEWLIGEGELSGSLIKKLDFFSIQTATPKSLFSSKSVITV